MTVTVVQGAYHRRVNSSIQTVVADPVYNVPAAYTGEAIKEATFGNAITATANKVYNVALTDIAASPAAIAHQPNRRRINRSMAGGILGSFGRRNGLPRLPAQGKHGRRTGLRKHAPEGNDLNRRRCENRLHTA